MDSILSTPAGEPFPYKQYFLGKREAGRVFVGLFAHELVPVELVRAAGVTIVPLVFVGPEDYSATGGAFISHSTCTFARNIVGAFTHEDIRFYKEIDCLVRSNYCNGDFCGMEYISREFNIPKIDLAIPIKARPHSVAYFAEQLRTFERQLAESLRTNTPDGEVIRQIKLHNAARLAVRKLPEIGIRGVELLRRYQEVAILEPSETVERLNALYFENAGFKAEDVRKTEVRPPIMFTGDPIFVNDFLAASLEDFGASIAYYDTWIGARMGDVAVDEVDAEVDYYLALARAYMAGQGLERVVPSGLEARLVRAEKLVKERGFAGIINHTLKFCDLQSIGRGEFKERLGKTVPVLDVERDYSESGLGGLKTRIEAFIELISGGAG